MSIYKRLDIKSRIHNYSAMFISNFSDGLKDDAGEKFFFIIDNQVLKYYTATLGSILKKYPYLIIEASETSKSLNNIKVVIRCLIDKNIKKDYTLVAIGGGVIQDITGFVASILYRGVRWIFYPTTLLAQCDSCIGSKTSINVDEYKNQVGNFYPPHKIFLDIGYLKTLPLAELQSGFGEIIKVCLLDGDKSIKSIIKNYDKAFGDSELMSRIIYKSLLIKKKIIEKDEFDAGYRNIMNYGHTFGHALESLSGYRLPHGQAVTVGMDISNYLSYKLRFITKRTYCDMKEILLKNWPDYSFKNIDLDIFFVGLSRDKKNIENKITAILTNGPGKMFKWQLLLDSKTKGYFCSYFSQFN